MQKVLKLILVNRIIHITKMVPNNPLFEQIWDVESNRICAECLKQLDLKEEVHVMLYPAVILLCEDCKNIHFSIASKRFQEAQNRSNDVQQKLPSNSKLK